ncbi:MAG: hypothetical protein HY744_31745, partial [Deltaproteobacteria bacterium]|nr:hypothetical protein [Deltaproteobacteria bacterium]
MVRGTAISVALLAVLCAPALGCAGSPDDGGKDGASSTSSGAGGGGAQGGGGPEGGAGGGAQAACTEPANVPCSDQVFQQMNMQDDITPGLITNEADGAGWRSHIDATAGGMAAPDPDSYTYGRFTDAGMEKVAISD